MVFAIPSELHSEFVAAGWSPGRQVPPPLELVSAVGADHPAVEILSAFSGLRVGDTGPGEECAGSDIDVQWLGPEQDEEIALWEKALDTHLVGIAEYHRVHSELYVGSDGRCFGLSLVHDAFVFEGETFAIAAVRLIRGRCARPMLRADQTTVMLYGIEYTHESPEVYRPTSRAE